MKEVSRTAGTKGVAAETSLAPELDKLPAAVDLTA
jgi:hypothetical protein